MTDPHRFEIISDEIIDMNLLNPKVIRTYTDAINDTYDFAPYTSNVDTVNYD